MAHGYKTANRDLHPPVRFRLSRPVSTAQRNLSFDILEETPASEERVAKAVGVALVGTQILWRATVRRKKSIQRTTLRYSAP